MLTCVARLGALVLWGLLLLSGSAEAQQDRLGFTASTATWGDCGIQGKQFICVWDKATPDLKQCAGFYPIDSKTARLVGTWCEDHGDETWCADRRALVSFADSAATKRITRDYNISSDQRLEIASILRTWSDKVAGFPFSEGLILAHQVADKVGKAYGPGITPSEFVDSLPASDP